ncbi:hypothetical protein AB0395_40785 [Streptosporangium sp. NPDC051023]|uniref:hypothetical protein n=1 Tax=Streptosporangium sp. NPDC051023 TaxID=3155410 RepID=UPI00344D01F9
MTGRFTEIIKRITETEKSYTLTIFLSANVSTFSVFALLGAIHLTWSNGESLNPLDAIIFSGITLPGGITFLVEIIKIINLNGDGGDK